MPHQSIHSCLSNLASPSIQTTTNVSKLDNVSQGPRVLSDLRHAIECQLIHKSLTEMATPASPTNLGFDTQKKDPEVQPPKNDPISIEQLSKCDGMVLSLHWHCLYAISCRWLRLYCFPLSIATSCSLSALLSILAYCLPLCRCEFCKRL